MGSTAPTALNAARRARDWDALAAGHEPDLLVIGGGVTGAGVALDAAARGLDVVLVDAHDLAFGTSRWSSKLAHGGLRYLASGNVGIAMRSARERGILMETTAPHLIRALPQVVPVHDSVTPAALLPRVGFLAGDLLRAAAGTSSATLPWSRTVSKRRVAELAPTVRRDGLRFGFLNNDGQLVDDARLVVALARTAAGRGARVLTKVRATDADGTGATLTDELTGESIRLRAAAVVNATGVWAGQLAEGISVRPSRGTHLVVDAAALGNPAGSLTVPVPGRVNRFCFVLPAQLGRAYVGITDEASPGPIPDVPEVPEADVVFLLDVINRFLERPLTRDDVIGAFSGLRPLIDAGDGDTADLSRDHAILVGDDGLITVTGGKLTEYRLMAQEAVDRVVERVVAGRGGSFAECTTATVPLVGAPGADDESGPAADGPIPESLILRHGAEAAAVVAACPLDRPLDPVAPGIDVVRAEFAWHVTREGALDVGDVLDRRSRIGLVESDREAAVDAALEALELRGASN
ncbi:glycerol-3-phosphate dehydrogenase/oxidase [uncultured Corynebacterium sp.]|uniref:glycerol-3-phosphate dehydrogenase/oxidase n=1 Tax=uncultured Corynebacterium sp. TaxID=159447 RepID=UPI0025F00129|nr:glycerol-3-phosphate dehydrogenase/oxidase [uncultured Corynebacterium sp.]